MSVCDWCVLCVCVRLWCVIGRVHVVCEYSVIWMCVWWCGCVWVCVCDCVTGVCINKRIHYPVYDFECKLFGAGVCVLCGAGVCAVCACDLCVYGVCMLCIQYCTSVHTLYILYNCHSWAQLT